MTRPVHRIVIPFFLAVLAAGCEDERAGNSAASSASTGAHGDPGESVPVPEEGQLAAVLLGVLALPVLAGLVPGLSPVGGLAVLMSGVWVFGLTAACLEPRTPEAGWTAPTFAAELSRQGWWLTWAPLWYVAPFAVGLVLLVPAPPWGLRVLMGTALAGVAVVNVVAGRTLRARASAIEGAS